MAEIVERIVRSEDSIIKLSSIANDIAKVLAVVEQRIQQIEKDEIRIEKEAEKEIDTANKKIENLNENIKNINNNISLINEKLNENNKQIGDLIYKLAKLEKWNWMAIGGGISIGFVLSVIFKAAPFLH